MNANPSPYKWGLRGYGGAHPLRGMDLPRRLKSGFLLKRSMVLYGAARLFECLSRIFPLGYRVARGQSAWTGPCPSRSPGHLASPG